MTELPDHPGVVHYTDAFTGESKPRPADEIPVTQKFVFRRQGVECVSPDEADEIIPIVEVRVRPLSAERKLVHVDDAVQLVVVAYGPDDQVLRRTTMNSVDRSRG